MYKHVPNPWEYGWLRIGDSGGGGAAPAADTFWPPPISMYFRVVGWIVVTFTALAALAANAAW